MIISNRIKICGIYIKFVTCVWYIKAAVGLILHVVCECFPANAKNVGNNSANKWKKAKKWNYYLSKHN